MSNPKRVLRDYESVKVDVQGVAEEDNKHDKHYLEAVVEPIKVMEKMFTKEELKGFIKGNILKYRLRMGHKDDIQKEMDKIRVYEQWLAKLERGEALIDEK